MRLHIPALLTIAAVGLGSAPVAGQTLADIAKKEEERRKTVKPADKTYTNKDLGTLPPGTPPLSRPSQPPRLTQPPRELRSRLNKRKRKSRSRIRRTGPAA